MPMFKERALSRKEKEELYVRKFTELQTMWRNPIGPSDPEYQRDPSGYWNFVKEWDDKQLDESIRNATEQIKFERGWSGCASVINFIVVAFVVLGVTVFWCSGSNSSSHFLDKIVDMRAKQFVAISLAGVIAYYGSRSSDCHPHVPTQTLQSVASPVASGNNNNAAIAWNGWPSHVTVEMNAHNARFLQPPYAGSGNNSSENLGC